MQSVDDAFQIMVGAVLPLGAETVALEDAQGRILAAPIEARRDQPPFNASAMDGYALRASDTPGTLQLVGESAAGHPYGKALQAGEAVRISTGAPIPEGADAILIQEDAKLDGGRLVALETPLGQHVRPRAGDYASGAPLLSAGHMLDSGALALIASSGYPEAPVMRRPRIAILSGGDEVVAPGSAARADQVFDTSYSVAALIRDWGGDARRRAPMRDDEQLMAGLIDEALSTSDLVVMIGGASVGPHDHARTAAQRFVCKTLVQKIAVRPGKPTWFALTDRAPILGLPGNPASALVCARLFLGPIIQSLLGQRPERTFIAARARRALPANGPRESYVRSRLETDSEGGLQALAFDEQDSSLVKVLANSNALIRRAPNAPAAAAGELVDCLVWSPRWPA